MHVRPFVSASNLPSNEFLLVQFLITTDIEFADDVDRTFLRIFFPFTLRFTDEIVLKYDRWLKTKKKKSLNFTIAAIMLVNSF